MVKDPLIKNDSNSKDYIRSVSPTAVSRIMFGLRSEELAIIIDVIKLFPQVEEAIIFGSRALDRNKKGSDIDIALKGNELKETPATISGLLNDESPLPFFFDIIDYNTITNSKLREHINKVGKSIYKKS